MLFAVVDIETTGGNARSGKITEIAIIITDGKEIIETFESLVDPGMYIPSFITNLTGITNIMVESAPDFNQIAPRVYELLKDKIFVAHNVNFDYSFVKKQLDESGFSIDDKKLCTVKYSRKITPGHRSYSLANNCLRFNIKNNAAHRAMGDTKATTILLHKLLHLDEKDSWQTLVFGKEKDMHLPVHLSKSIYDNLTENTGVYYFKDKLGKIIYIGKANNIKKRVQQHFSGDKISEKSQALYRNLSSIETVETGSEILALLLEDSEIRKYWPPLNKAQKSNPTKFHLSYYKDQNNNWRLCIVKGKHSGAKISTTFSWMESRETLFEIVKSNNLSPELCQVKLDTLNSVSHAEHNSNFENLLDSIQTNPTNFLIWEKGVKEDESAFILVRDSLFFGFGFIPEVNKTTKYSELERYIQPIISSGMSAKYISNYLNTNANLSISIMTYTSQTLLF